MKLSDAITWVFQHPELSLSAAGGLAGLLLGLSFWGIRRTLRRRNEALLLIRPIGQSPALSDLADSTRAAAKRADNGRDILAGKLEKTGETGNATLELGRIHDEPLIEESAAPAAPPEPEPEPNPAQPEPEPAPAKFTEIDLRTIAEAVFNRNFPRLDNSAHEEAAAKFAIFVDRLAISAEERLSPEKIARVAHADVQLLICSLMAEVSKREDKEKYGVLIALLIGRIKHHDNPNITELLDHAIEEVGRINVEQLRVVIMCLYLRGFQLKSGGIEALEKVVKYALEFGMGANFANMRTGLLFTRGLLMHNGALERVEIQILRKYAAAFQGGQDMPKNMERAAAVKLVHEKLNLSPDQCAVMEAWGQTQSGHATATGIGWAAAAAYIEHRTNQPADWQRVIS